MHSFDCNQFEEPNSLSSDGSLEGLVSLDHAAVNALSLGHFGVYAKIICSLVTKEVITPLGINPFVY